MNCKTSHFYSLFFVLLMTLSSSLFTAQNPLILGTPIAINDPDFGVGVFSPVVIGVNSDGYMATYSVTDKMTSDPRMDFSFSTNGSSWSSGVIIDEGQPQTSIWNVGTLAGFLAGFPYPPPGGISTSVQSSFSSDQGTNWSAFSVVDAGPGVNFTTLTQTINVPGGVLITWLESGINYTSFSSNNGTTWSSPIAIGSPTAASSSAFLCLNSSGLLASWRNSTSVVTSFSSNLGTTWSSNVTVATGASGEVICSCNSEGFIVVWIDFTLQEMRSSFSTDNGTTWTTPATVSDDISTNVNNRAFVTASDTGFVATWVDGAGNVSAAFSDDNGSTWSDPTSITNDGAVDLTARSLIYAVCDGDTCLLSWRQATTFDAMVSLGTLDVSPNPPGSISGKQLKNSFGLQFELFSLIEWSASDSASLAGYYVYRNGTRIATLSQNTLAFEDHNQPKGSSQSYTVTAFDSSGRESSSISVIVNP